MRRLLALPLLAALTSGCATYAWSRAGTPPALAAQDVAECQQLALDASRDIAFSAFPRLYAGPAWWPYSARGWPYGGWSAWGDPFWWGPTGDPFWRLEVEQRINDRCMRGRGYELERVPDD